MTEAVGEAVERAALLPGSLHRTDEVGEEEVGSKKGGDEVLLEEVEH